MLIYRSTKVINFAVGNIGLFGSGLMVICNLNYGVPLAVGSDGALVVGTLWGAIIELTVVRRLFRAPRVILLVATIVGAVAGDPHRIAGERPPRHSYPMAIGKIENTDTVHLKGHQTPSAGGGALGARWPWLVPQPHLPQASSSPRPVTQISPACTGSTRSRSPPWSPRRSAASSARSR